jgi:hypothetical protein
MGLIVVNYGNENANRENPSGEIHYLCGFDERWSCATSLTGGLMSGYYVPPYAYPGYGTAWANGGSMICNNVAMSPVGSNAQYPGYSKLIASFGKPECSNPNSTSPMDVAELSVELSGQGLPVPNQSLVWGSDAPEKYRGTPLDDGTVAAFAIIVEGTYSVRNKYCISINFQGIQSYMGCINSSAFTIGADYFAAGRLLFAGYNAHQTVTNTGSMQVEREYKFGIMCAYDNWNQLLNPKGDFVATPVTPSGDPMYRQVDFSGLFS